MQWGYKTLPEAKTYILKNVTDTDMKLSFNRSKECSVLLSGNAYLAPGESTELRLWPKLGLSVGKYSFSGDRDCENSGRRTPDNAESV